MISRRAFLTSTVAFAALRAAADEAVPRIDPVLDPAVSFSPEKPLEMARDLASRPYAPRASVPQDWLDLEYDDYRLFWFNVENALWRNEALPVADQSPLEVDFFLPGLYFPRGVGIYSVEGDEARHIAFDLALFDRTDGAPSLSTATSLDYSGFRLRSELYEPGVHTEFCVFQGASYFRALGKEQVYGLSARGLAVDTAEETGEEFPEFTHFWIEKPARGDGPYVVHALLDSPSVTGAYRFEIDHSGDDTQMQVEATLIPREDMAHVGIAPLTSMFLFDETNRHRFNDFRPTVHDSEGLAIHNGNGEYIWRPLANPVGLQVSAFGDNNPRGFGLMQRNRRFSDYADLEAQYHRRPSLWITPGENWGAGSVTLVEIPADKEIYDNIVAYWRPAAPLAAGREHSLSYHMAWGDGPQPDPGVARVLNTRMGDRIFSEGILATVDFELIDVMTDRFEDFTMVVTSNTGEILGAMIQENPDTLGPRLAVTFDPKEETVMEVRAQLYLDERPVTEVFLYRWTAG